MIYVITYIETKNELNILDKFLKTYIFNKNVMLINIKDCYLYYK